MNDGLKVANRPNVNIMTLITGADIRLFPKAVPLGWQSQEFTGTPEKRRIEKLAHSRKQ